MIRLLILVGICAVLPTAAAAQPLHIHADSYPVAYFTERIAGDLAEVTLPVPADRDPSHWSPPIPVIAAFQAADLIVLNGAGLAQWTARATLPRGKIVDSSAGFADRLIVTDGVTHSHGAEGEHSHTGTASFTWLDFSLAGLQATAIAAALETRLPSDANVLSANLESLLADLSALDAAASELLGPASACRFLAPQSRYQYFARRYGFDIETIAWDPSMALDPDQIAMIGAALGASPVVMLWEGDPVETAQSVLSDRGFVGVAFDPAVHAPSDGDFVSTMAANLARLGEVLEEAGC